MRLEQNSLENLIKNYVVVGAWRKDLSLTILAKGFQTP
jgi:hypothetical protein